MGDLEAGLVKATEAVRRPLAPAAFCDSFTDSFGAIRNAGRYTN